MSSCEVPDIFFLTISTKVEFYGQFIIKVSSINVRMNPSSASCADTCGYKDEHDVTNSRFLRPCEHNKN